MEKIHQKWLEDAKNDGVENLDEWLQHRIALDEAKNDDEWCKEANWFGEQNDKKRNKGAK